MAAAAILDLWNFKFLTVGAVKRVELHDRAKFRQNRPNCGWDMEFFGFQDGHLGCLIFRIFNGRDGQDVRNASLCQIWWKSVGPRLRYGDFSIFQDGGRPPSWICNACVVTTHEGHLVVFIAVQNLVGIDAVVVIICTFFDFASLAWKRLFTPKIGGF